MAGSTEIRPVLPSAVAAGTQMMIATARLGGVLCELASRTQRRPCPAKYSASAQGANLKLRLREIKQ
jgi:hypothetical protein